MHFVNDLKSNAYLQVLVTDLSLVYIIHKVIYIPSSYIQVNSYGILNYQSNTTSKIITLLIQTSNLNDKLITYNSYVAYIDLMESNALFYTRPI
jgi:hypothetical protein